MSAAEDLEASLRSPALRVETLRGGGRRVTFIGEPTARNSEQDTLASLESLALRAGFEAGVERSRLDSVLWIGPREAAEQEETVNDIGHPLACDCPGCLPEIYDPAEQLAGRSDRT